jgi:hypothetical protein
MAFFQSLGRVALLIVTSSNHATYGIMASPPSFSILPEMPSGPTDLLLPNAANLFLMILALVMKGTPDFAHFICGILRSQLKE